jgi:hypothetical protein
MKDVTAIHQDILAGQKIRKFEIKGDKIDSSSIIYKGDNKEHWTRACKCLLANMQYLCVLSKFKDERNQRDAHREDPVYKQNLKE